MNVPTKIAVYVAGLAVAFTGAWGVGTLTGSPADETEQPPSHAEEHAGDGHGGDGHEPGGDPGPAGLRVSEAGYTLSPIQAPASTGEAGRLSFQILDPDGHPVTEFTESHEKELHLIVVRSDTTEFRHVHPALDPDGTWSIDWTWPVAGSYKVFADFTPAGLGDGLTLARTVDVAGDFAPAPPPSTAATGTVAEVDGYTVTLTGALVADGSAAVTATVERDGQPVTDLEPYLGAYGHLVALRDGDLAYVHVHPDGEPGDGVTEPGPEVTFVVEAPTAATYRLFLDFQVAGRVHTADFTLTAAPAAPGAHE